MTDLGDLFGQAAHLAARYRADADGRPVRADHDRATSRARFALPLPDGPTPPERVLAELASAADGGLVTTVGPRYFGFVIGGALPAASAADLLATGWDQCAYSPALSPAAAGAEDAAAAWITDLLELPPASCVGYVTGAQAANTVGLAAGRHAVLARAGWDVERDGLIGAPRVRVVAGVERHATIDRALRLLGLGTASVAAVAADANGAVDADDLAAVLEREPGTPTIVCLQAGNVNTGACDDFTTTIPLARQHDAWVHVDGAFGLWAAASPGTRHLVRGVAAADSWGCDAHKWLNVPYDSGLAICAHPEVQAAAMAYSAAYLVGSGNTADPTLGDLVPESSRRARGFAVWAALRELGRSGVADLVDRCCALARRMADRLAAGGAVIHNDVVLNQVLVGFGPDVDVDAVIERVQSDGTCWVGGTTWRGARLIRVAVSNWSTTEHDIDLSAAAILRAASG